MRRIGVVAVLGLALLAACSGSGSEGSSAGNQSESSGQASDVGEDSAGSGPSSDGDVESGEAPDRGAAKELVSAARGSLPYSDAVAGCVVERLAVSGELRSDAESLDVMTGVAAACSVEVEGAPRFSASLQERAGGGLSDKQVACAQAEYAALSAEELSELLGAVLNLNEGDREALALYQDILDECGISFEGGS